MIALNSKTACHRLIVIILIVMQVAPLPPMFSAGFETDKVVGWLVMNKEEVKAT